MIEQITQALENAVKDLTGEDHEIVLEQARDFNRGDFACSVAMQLAKILGKPPINLAKEIVEKLNTLYPISDITYEIAGPGFINFKFSKNVLLDLVVKILEQKDDFGQGEDLKNKKILVEFAHPNTHKAFHIGHLRNISLGESLARILEFEKAKIFRANYQGDIGMHVAKCIWALKKENKKNFDDLKTPQVKAEYLGKIYAIGGQAYEALEKAKIEIQEINKALYKGEDLELMNLYKQSRQWSLDYFDYIYKRLGTHFDRLFFESECFSLGKELVLQNVGKIFTKSKGAIVFEGEKYGLHTRVFVSSEGNPTYEAKDMGLAKLQKETFDFDANIHVVANEQTEYFKVIFEAMYQIFPELKGKQYHLAYGMVKLTSGKMSSRTGEVVMAEWLIDTAKEEIGNLIQNKEDFSLEELEEIKEKVAVGAIKFMMLSSGAKNDIAFDLKKAIRLDGDSGPYIQYAYARIRSILRKSGQPPIISNQQLIFENCNENDWGLIRKLLYFEEAVKRASKNYSPHYICHYLLDLTSEFSSWYSKNRVLDEEENLKNARLAILASVAQVLKNGLYLLGIETLERM